MLGICKKSSIYFSMPAKKTADFLSAALGIFFI